MNDALGVLGRIVEGDVSAVADLQAVAWGDVIEAMRFVDRSLTREAAKRVLHASRDSEIREEARTWASLVREGSLDPWVLEDGVLVSRPIHPGQPEVEFPLESGFEDAILDVIHRIDDINIDGPIADDEYGTLLASLS